MGADRQLLGLGTGFLSRAFVVRRLPRARRLIALLGAAGMGTGFGVPCPAAAATGSEGWSTPRTLSTCPALETAQVLFPGDSPSDATGPGAVLWRASPRCAGGEGARISHLDPDGVPGAESPLRTAAGRPIALTGPLAASVAPHGEIMLASTGGLRTGVGQLAEGLADGPFSPLAAVAAPFALAHGYLGDVAVASALAAGTCAAARRALLRADPRSPPGAARREPTRGSRTALARARLPHRRTRDLGAGRLAAGSLATRIGGRAPAPAPGERSGCRPREPRCSATTTARSLLSPRTSAAGPACSWPVRARAFASRRRMLLEQFRDPPGVPAPSASPRLVRLSSESVMIAWAGVAAGRWVIRTRRDRPARHRRSHHDHRPLRRCAPGGARARARGRCGAVVERAAEALPAWRSTPRAASTPTPRRRSSPRLSRSHRPVPTASRRSRSTPRAIVRWRSGAGAEDRLQYSIRATPHASLSGRPRGEAHRAKVRL